MNDLYGWMETSLGFSSATEEKIIVSIVALVVLALLRWIIILIVHRMVKKLKLHYQWLKATNYVIGLIGVFTLSWIWIKNIQSLATFLGLFTAGLAIALRDPVANVMGWLYILARRPFEVGDRIEIGSHIGDVIDQSMFQITVVEVGNWVDADQSTGRMIHIPNGKVFTEPVANYTEAFAYIWNEIPVHVTFESDWQTGKKILLDIVNNRVAAISREAKSGVERASQKFMLWYPTLTPIVYTSVVDHGVRLTIRYLTPPRKRRSTESIIWEDILESFAQDPKITFAYPTQRIYYRRSEKGETSTPTFFPPENM